jgi:hypothetical protein
VDEYLPAEYENALATLSMIVKEMWALQPNDNRELILSRELIEECTAIRIDLVTSGTVDRAVKFVDRHRGLTSHGKVTIDNDTPRPQ